MMLRPISTFESGLMMRSMTEERMKGSDRLMYQSKSYRSGIRNTSETKVTIALISRRKFVQEAIF